MTFKAMLHLMENLPNFNVSNHRNMFIKISSLTISYLNKVFPDPGKETRALMGRLPDFPNLTRSYIIHLSVARGNSFILTRTKPSVD